MPAQPSKALEARLARAMWVAFEVSSEKVRGRIEQLELAFVGINALLAVANLT